MAKFNLIGLACVTLLYFVHYQKCCVALDLKKCYINMIFQLGDSLSDTGNYITESKSGADSVYAKLPYGETFFNKSTGRCSNGRIILDYLAVASGLAFIEPYKITQTYYKKNGDNFATAGATALPVEFLASQNISSITTTDLGTQVVLLFNFLNRICVQDCVEMLKNSLFMVGEIGMNDYIYALLQGKSIQETTALVPHVTSRIQDAIGSVISDGANRIVVPGIFPLGCLPALLTRFQTQDSTAYDKYQCLSYLNDLSQYHNSELQKAIEELQKQLPDSIILYADYYKAYTQLLQNASQLKFDVKNLQKACCGTGGAYNYDPERTCGARGVDACAQPSSYISWDGINLTEAAYEYISQSLVADILPKLDCAP